MAVEVTAAPPRVQLGPDDEPRPEWRTGRRRAERLVATVAHALARPTAAKRPLPDFLVVGTQRGGTTSLYRYLCDHPAVVPAVLEKGVHYFDTRPGRSAAWYRSRFPTSWARTRAARRSGAPSVTGEASPYYLFHPAAPTRARAIVPDARIIVLLRDPMTRAYSHHRHERMRGFERLPFDEAVRREAARLDFDAADIDGDPAASFRHRHFSYVARGRYFEQLERWFAAFPANRIHVIVSEQFFAEPERVFLDVQRFLELPEHRLTEYPIHNARGAAEIPEHTWRFLAERLTGPTDALRGRLGIDPPWSV